MPDDDDGDGRHRADSESNPITWASMFARLPDWIQIILLLGILLVVILRA